MVKVLAMSLGDRYGVGPELVAKLVDRLGPEPGDRIETALGDTIKRLARRAAHEAGA